MSHWWENSQPRGAKPLPIWAIALFVLVVALVGAAFWYGDTTTVVAAVGASLVVVIKFVGRASSKLADAGTMSWPIDPRRPSAPAPKHDPKRDLHSLD